jgi:hypothetical protein
MSGALEVEFAHTGSAVVGAESFSVYTPTLFVGQGLAACLTIMHGAAVRADRPDRLPIPSKSSITSD